LDDEYIEDMSLTLSEMKANKAYTIVISHSLNKLPSSKIDFSIEIPSLGYFTPMLGILPIQKTSLYISELKGINVDKPRNLAKTVTVQ
jgi:glucosamine--fructose-6-phosphate aminotransferase (isomerizing)